MQPALVLNEEGKKERFKVSIAKKKRDAKSPVISSENSLTEVNLDLTYSTSISPAISSCQTIKPLSDIFHRYDHRPIVTVAPLPSFSSQPFTTSLTMSKCTQDVVMSTKLNRKPEATIHNNLLQAISIYPTASFTSSRKQNFNQNVPIGYQSSFMENKLFIQADALKEKEESAINLAKIQPNINFSNTHNDNRKSVIQVTSESKHDTSELNIDSDHDEKDPDKQMVLKYANENFDATIPSRLPAIKKCDTADEPFTHSSNITNRSVYIASKDIR